MSKEANALMNTANVALKDIIQSVTSVKEFMMTQIPDVLHQLLMWQFAHNVIWLIVNCIVVYFTYWLCKNAFISYNEYCDQDAIMRQTQDTKVHKEAKTKQEKIELRIVVTGFLGIITGIISFAGAIPGAIDNFETALKIWIAPKIFLIEYAAELVK